MVKTKVHSDIGQTDAVLAANTSTAASDDTIKTGEDRAGTPSRNANTKGAHVVMQKVQGCKSDCRKGPNPAVNK